jgi:hypothetical protein
MVQQEAQGGNAHCGCLSRMGYQLPCHLVCLWAFTPTGLCFGDVCLHFAGQQVPDVGQPAASQKAMLLHKLVAQHLGVACWAGTTYRAVTMKCIHLLEHFCQPEMLHSFWMLLWGMH